jgi:TonB-linked SusC/RagA family outer membrane protein
MQRIPGEAARSADSRVGGAGWGVVGRWRRLIRAAGAALLGAVAPLGGAVAQGTGAVAGTVVSAGSGVPLGDAQVSVTGSPLGASTDANGRFRISGLSGTSVELTVRRIGFRPATVTAAIGTTTLRIELAERAVDLQQVVVTGTAGIAEKKAIGNAVSTIKASDVVSTQPIRSFQDLLTGRATGVSVIGSSGQVGTGSRIRVRGASSLSLSNDPLIYVDGIRVDNTQASGPSNQGFGSASISRWNDFDPDDIESIEVIKGPAAATLYGTEASNGVIQIVTKKGAAGRPVWNFTFRGGGNQFANWQEILTDKFTNWGAVPRPGGGLDTVTINARQLNDSLRATYGNDIFTTGALQEFNANVSGGSALVRYFVGANYEENQGAERVNRLFRSNLRANLTITPSTQWEVQTSMGYTTGRTYLPFEAGGGGATWGSYFSSPGFLFVNPSATSRVPNNPQLGFRSGPPNVYYEAYNVFQDADRFTGSVQVQHRPVGWFNQRLILGVDRLAESNADMAPRNQPIATRFPAFAVVGAPTNGSITVGSRDVTLNSADYIANAQFRLGEDWQSISSAGGQYYGRRSRFRSVNGQQFPAAGLTSVASAAVQSTPSDGFVDNNTIGGFVQQQVVWKDRLFLTGAIRADDNSSFGANFDAITYPKVSASYVISEEPFFRIPAAINTLRLRAAYGGSGQQPSAFSAVRSFTATGGFLTPAASGNPDLGPEQSYETELGFDLGAFNDRYGIEFTYFTGYTRDAILSRQAPPSAGFPGTQFFNAGRVDRNGLEALIRAQPIRSGPVTLDLTLSASTNNYTIADLGGNPRVSLSNVEQHVVGYAPGAWWDRRVVSADKDPTGRAINLQCDNGAGGAVPCAQAPRVFLGNTVPTHEGSFTTGLTLFRNLRLGGFLDWRGGYKKLDGNRRVRCNLFALCRQNYFPTDPQYSAIELAEIQGGTAFTYNLIQDASFLRLRELSASYTLPAAVARGLRASRATVTLAGRNLGLWTDFQGLDPEASFNGGTRGGFGQWDQNVLPQLRQYVVTVNLSF